MPAAFDIAEFQAKAAQFIAANQERAAEVAAAGERRRAADRSKADRLAKERLAGEHGRDWQVLQERIDMRKTTMRDILCGLDHSPEARAVREVFGKNTARVHDALVEVSQNPDGPAAQRLVKRLASHDTEIV